MSEGRVLVTIAIPSYNHGRYVGEAIECALAQTEPSAEVLVVDDGSTDETLQVLERYRGRAKVRIIEKQNRGVSPTFNVAWREARGEFIGYLCSDDRWHPEHLARALPALVEDPGLAMVYGRAQVIDGEGHPVPEEASIFGPYLPNEDLFERLCRGANFLSFVSAVMRRDVLETVGGFDEELSILQDYDLWLRISARHRVRFLDDESVTVRWHGANESYWSARGSVVRRRDQIRIYEKLLREERALLRERGLVRVVRSRLASSYAKLGRRVGGREARECFRRALSETPLRAEYLMRYLISFLSPQSRNGGA